MWKKVGNIKGKNGEAGLNAYALWLSVGNKGNLNDFLLSLKGKDGLSIKGDKGDSIQGENGLSAYQIWLNKGNKGTEKQFLQSLKGRDGIDGVSIELTTINDVGELIITKSNGESVNLGDIRGRDAQQHWATWGYTNLKAVSPLVLPEPHEQISLNIPALIPLITGLTVANFASPNISQWTNDAGYITSASIINLPYCNLYSGTALPANTYNNGSSGVGATLTANANGALTVVGVAVTTGISILVNGESSAANNGIYIVTATGSVSTPYILTRRGDFNLSTNIIPGAQVFVVSGVSSGANTEWILNNAGTIPVVVGTTTIHFTQTAGIGTYTASGGGGITLSGNDFSLTTIGTGGTGGSASVVPVFGYNTKGQVTGVVPTSIQIAESQVTGLTTDLISAFRSDTFAYSHAGGV